MATTTTTTTTEEATAAPSWQQIHGSDNWSGLLSPIDICLRRELIRYGDFVTAISDGINNVEESKLLFYPFYGKSALFSAVGLQHTADTYSITRYLYATTYNDDGNTSTSLWMGFIAVSRDAESRRLGRRDIVVSFRGTLSDAEKWEDLNAFLVPFPNLGGSVAGAPLVHKGFLALYNTDPAPDWESRIIATDSLRWQVVKELRSLLDKYEGETVSVSVVGHSLGGALATLCVYDMANNGVLKNGSSSSTSAQLAAFTYASPKVGDETFRQQFEDVLGLKLLRVVDKWDVVPTLPPLPFPYVHTGVELLVDGRQSTYIKPPSDDPMTAASVAHDLEGYLHTVAGIAGSLETDDDHEFWLRVKRDIALVNKRTESLKDEYGIRKNWWVLRNKGMLHMIQTDGEWIWRPAYLDLLTNLAADPDFV